MPRIHFLSCVLVCTIVYAVLPTTQYAKSKRSVTSRFAKTWPNGNIPYVVEPNAFTEVDMKLLHKAMQTIEEETCIQFSDHTYSSHPLNFSHIVILGNTERGCYSEIGSSSDAGQQLILGQLCRSYGQMLHELLHAVGLMHETMRPDRDEYIILHQENIIPEHVQEFEKLDWEQAAFSKNGHPVWEPKVPLNNIPLFNLNEKDLSFDDALSLNKLYNCGGHCKAKSKCRSTEYLAKDCRCEKPYIFAHRRCRDDPTETGYCSSVVRDNKCYDESRYAIAFCRRSCGRCFRSGSFGNAKPPKMKCLDNEPYTCSDYVKEGFCYFDRWTKMNCRKSCNLCPPPKVARRLAQCHDSHYHLTAHNEGKCYNRYDDLYCEVFASRGDCKNNPDFMLSQCSQACGICEPNSEDEESYLRNYVPPCRNYIDDERCNALAAEGKCNGTTLRQCLESCGQCGPKPVTSGLKPAVTTATTPVTVNVMDCQDTTSSCIWLAANGRCLTDKQSMIHLCPLSCKFCTPPCQDQDSTLVCDDIYRRGYCQYSDVYRERCAKTCGVCSDEDGVGRLEMSGLKPSLEIMSLRVTTASTVSKSLTTMTSEIEISAMSGNTDTKQATVGSRWRKKDMDISKNPRSKCNDMRNEKTCEAWAQAGFCSQPHIVKLCQNSCDEC